MSNNPSSSKEKTAFDDDEIFEDSSILANFDNSSFRDKTGKFSENNINDSYNKNALNVSALCCDEEISGYDKLSGATWIYPTNYPVRDYQFNIIKAAILKNTLVSLPTGLGKTFIAAVIMYNFYRWYPLGKIIFTAPTRPLVAQQIEACYNIAGIPPNDTVEMTGHMQVNTRKTHWQTKRVFFATPQVIYNDIKSGICPGDQIRCLVIDEAHRARGNYAYCQIVATLDDMGCKVYRVLALSATPGSKVDDVVTVVRNLHIAHLELRTENCIDVAPYSHSRRVSTVIVPLGPELTRLRDKYIEILDGYARRLKQMNILPHNLGNLSKGRLVMLYKDFQNRDRSNRHPEHNHIMKDFTMLISLYHGLELLVKHGSRVFLNFFDEHPEKSWIQADDRLTAFLERLRDDLGVNPMNLIRSVLPDGTVPEIPKNITFGHPKFIKLKEIILEHFNKAKSNEQDTKAIVFCEYRESVNLVHCLLLQSRPLVVPMMFVGHGNSGAGKEGKAAISQKQQIRVMRSFREGMCNTLVATCVAEEGLDVGSVDLIVCFDISTSSPVRLVQRCGRTGRERGGQVHILVTEGREHQTLLDCMRQRDGLNKKILSSKDVHNALYASNPRMIPRDHIPQCQKMYITVAKKEDNTKKTQKDLRTMLLGRASSSSSSSSNNLPADLITDQEFRSLYPEGYRESSHFRSAKEYWAMDIATLTSTKKEDPKQLNLSTWLEWQRTLQETVNIGHSTDSEILAGLLQYSDAKRFDLPTCTQNPGYNTQDFATQNIISSPAKSILPAISSKVASPVKMSPAKAKQTKKKAKLPVIKAGKNDGDIRALFSTATKSTKSYTKLINDLGIQNTGTISTSLLNLLVDLNLNSATPKNNSCFICENICHCEVFKKNREVKKMTPVLKACLTELKLPDFDLLDNVDAESICKCVDVVVKESKDDLSFIDQVIEPYNVGNDTDLKKIDTRKVDDYLDIDIKNSKEEILDIDVKNCSKNFELEFDFDEPIDLTSPEKAEIKDDIDNEEKNFDLGDIEDIFAESSPEAAKETAEPKDTNTSDPKETLGFFGLDSIDDIFADSDESNFNKSPNTPKKETQNNKDFIPRENEQLKERLSPSILSGKVKNVTAVTSPILCSQVRKFSLSTKKNQLKSSTPVSTVKRQLLTETNNNFKTHEKMDSKTNFINSTIDTTNKSLFTITQLVDMINKTNDKSTTNASKVDENCDRSMSPILLTQADKKKSLNTNIDKTSKSNLSSQSKKESLIILESDSESDEDDHTQVYDVDNLIANTKIKDDEDVFEINSQDFKSLTKTELIENDSEILTEPLKSPIITKRKLSTENEISASVNNIIANTEIQEDVIEINSQDFESPVETKPIEKHSEILTEPEKSPIINKRKLSTDDEISLSPYFNKKPKLDLESQKQLSLKEKVLRAIKSDKFNSNFNNDKEVNFVKSPQKILAQKENKNPLKEELNTNTKEEYVRKNNLEMLQMFRRDSKISSQKTLVEPTTSKSKKRIFNFDDSDDDFVDSNSRRSKNAESLPANQRTNRCSQSRKATSQSGSHRSRTTTNHKVRKKSPRANGFLDLEADQSSDESGSGDELSDDSVGSIIDFICDDDVTHRDDMQAVYMESVKSAVKPGMFKIPQLPVKYNRAEVFSQLVDEDDTYQMDSFCVDSNTGLTQVNDMSELELAEMLLEERRTKKKRLNPRANETQDDGSPLVRKKQKVKRIHSDSDDSS